MLRLGDGVRASACYVVLLFVTLVPQVRAVHNLFPLNATSTAPPLSCPDDTWLPFPLERKCYKAFDTQQSWFACQLETCGPLGGAIATVDADNTDFLLRHMASD